MTRRYLKNNVKTQGLLREIISKNILKCTKIKVYKVQYFYPRRPCKNIVKNSKGKIFIIDFGQEEKSSPKILKKYFANNITQKVIIEKSLNKIQNLWILISYQIFFKWTSCNASWPGFFLIILKIWHCLWNT